MGPSRMPGLFAHRADVREGTSRTKTAVAIEVPAYFDASVIKKAWGAIVCVGLRSHRGAFSLEIKVR